MGKDILEKGGRRKGVNLLLNTPLVDILSHETVGEIIREGFALLRRP